MGTQCNLIWIYFYLLTLKYSRNGPYTESTLALLLVFTVTHELK